MPQRNEKKVKPATESSKILRRPKRLASYPASGNTIAFETRYDVKTQVASSGVTERSPAICGSDTLTTVVSSTSMKVPSITAMAMIQGLIAGLESAAIYLTKTVGSTESPWR